MQRRWARPRRWLLAWLVLSLAGGLALVRWDIAQRRAAFATDARIAHRLLSQRAVEVDAVLATLALLDPAAAGAERAAQRLPALHPQLLQVWRRGPGEHWPDPSRGEALRVAEQDSRTAGRAVLGPVDADRGRYTLLLATAVASHALLVDLQRLVPWADWPLARDGPVRVTLHLAATSYTLQPGAAPAAQPAGLTAGFVFAKTLDAPSQPFELRLQRATGPAQWPWGLLAAWTAAVAAALAAAATVQRQHVARRRAEELLRLGQVARLNTLGEMAAGMAHELNQPLAAVLANVQAARRQLDLVRDQARDHVPTSDAADDEADAIDAAREALQHAAAQARRAGDVVSRLRRSVEHPGGEPRAVGLDTTLRAALQLLEPECRRRGVEVVLHAPTVVVQADPVALEQIVHNLLLNALQALDAVEPGRRRLTLHMRADGVHGVLTVADSGPGIAAELLPRLFQPFVSGKPGGLGLGLSLSETLAAGMGGTLSARNLVPRGAEFRLALPLAGIDTR